MAIPKIGVDIIPFRAGYVKLTPLDANDRPMFCCSVVTTWDFLTSTQVSKTYETETLANGNGADETFINSETYNLTVVTNVYNHDFHATVSGLLKVKDTKVVSAEQFTYQLPLNSDGPLEITFGEGKDQPLVPVPNDDGIYEFVVEDNYGNKLIESTQTGEGTFVYDPDTQTMQFSDDYKGVKMRILFNYLSEEDFVHYISNPILKQPKFQIEVYGISQEAKTNEKVKIIQLLKRATVSGDITDMATQKSRSAPITYTFQSAPVADGISVYDKKIIRSSSNTAIGDGCKCEPVVHAKPTGGTGNGGTDIPNIGEGEVTPGDDEW